MRPYFNQNPNSLGKTLKRFALFGGINLILLSIIIFVFPEILAYAVAALVLMAGVSLTIYGLGVRRNQRNNGPTQHGQAGETIYYTY